MNTPPRIIITPGEPAGIGPDVLLNIVQQVWPFELVAVADPNMLQARAKQLGLPLTLSSLNLKCSAEAHRASHLKVMPIALNAPCNAGKLNPANASYVLECLKTAVDHCLQNHAQALVTGPVHKATMNQANIAFTGHTEFLADYCKVPQVIMLFVANAMRVALATTHLPLSQVPAAITKTRLTSIITLLAMELQKKFNIHSPKILVAGLNPHAGESGHLGREEMDVIAPAVDTLRQEGIDVIGPLPADTLFTEKHLTTADAILAMYHDQALPVVKYASFGEVVNVTLGLPIIRTSVDHGTAIDIAGTGLADANSMAAALRLAFELS